MEYTLRKTEEKDYHATEVLARQAFADRRRLPDDVCNEHYVLHLMRQSKDYIPALDYLAEDETRAVVGQITWSHAGVESADGTLHPAVTFGPVSVAPGLQSRGIGGMLIRHTIALARQQGHKRAVLMGHPAYYPRFGFEAAAKHGITAGDGKSYDACMVLPLEPGAFTGITGRIVESEAFTPDAKAFAAFEKGFAE